MLVINNDTGFLAPLDKACGRFMYKSAVTKMAQSSWKPPEFLARYCDFLLKKSSKNTEERSRTRRYTQSSDGSLQACRGYRCVSEVLHHDAGQKRFLA